MTDIPPAQVERERKAAMVRADRLQTTLDRMADLMAKQGDELAAIRKMLRRREAQLAKSEREVRKLRRQLGLDDPDPEPDAAPLPEEETEDASVTTEDDSGMEDNGDAGASPTEGRVSGDIDTGDKKTPRKKRTGGRRSPAAHVPANHERYDVCQCSHCGGAVFKRDVLRSAVYTAVQSYIRQRIIRRERTVCANPDCGKPTTAPMPPMPCNRALYDCAFIAWLVTMKFAFLMPLDRIQAMLASQKVFIAMGTLVHLVARATELADAVDGEHMKQLRAGTHICFDGTGLKVLLPGQGKAWDGYLEVFARDHLTVFQFDLTKHADALRERLGMVSAVLMTDAESRNKAGAPGATFGHCNAHPFRKLQEAVKVQPILALEGLAFLDELYTIEDAAKECELTGVALQAYRRRHCRPVLRRLRTWLRRVAQGDLPPSDPVKKVAKYYLKHWRGLTRYVGDPNLPIDNNEAEREFQRHAKLRYASLFAGSIEGAHRWATLLGVVRTAQKLDLDVQAYLTWMFERRGTHRKRFGMAAGELTPMAYKVAGCPGSLAADEALAA